MPTRKAVKKKRKKVADKAGRKSKKLPPDHWEVFLIKEMVNHKIPVPEREHRFHGTRRWRFDMAWPKIMLAVEVEGGIYRGGRHVTPVGYEKDCEKYSHAAMEGWCVIRVTPNFIKNGLAMAWIKEAFIRKYLEYSEEMYAGSDGEELKKARAVVKSIREAFGEDPK